MRWVLFQSQTKIRGVGPVERCDGICQRSRNNFGVDVFDHVAKKSTFEWFRSQADVLVLHATAMKVQEQNEVYPTLFVTVCHHNCCAFGVKLWSTSAPNHLQNLTDTIGFNLQAGINRYRARRIVLPVRVPELCTSGGLLPKLNTLPGVIPNDYEMCRKIDALRQRGRGDENGEILTDEEVLNGLSIIEIEVRCVNADTMDDQLCCPSRRQRFGRHKQSVESCWDNGRITNPPAALFMRPNQRDSTLLSIFDNLPEMLEECPRVKRTCLAALRVLGFVEQKINVGFPLEYSRISWTNL